MTKKAKSIPIPAVCEKLAAVCRRPRTMRTLPAVWMPELRDVRVSTHFLKPTSPYFHQGFVLKIHLSGTSCGAVEKNTCEFHPGDGMLVFPFQLHRTLSVDPPAGQLRLVVDFSLSPEDARHLEPLRNAVFRIDARDAGVLSRMVQFRDSADPDDQQEAFRLLTWFVATLPRKAAAVPPASGPAPRTRKVFDFVYDHYREGLTVKEIAEKLGYSEAGIRLIFRRETGRTPGNFMQEMRLRDAAEQLSCSAAPVNQIGAKCGFANAFVFSRAFKRRFGMSPKAFREKKRG